MLILSFFEWWYIRGFCEYLEKFGDTLKNAADFFSLRLLVENFFSPFRQISAGGTTSLALGDRLRALSDYLFSCVFGAVVRFFLLVLGSVIIAVQAVFGLVFAVLWPFAPFLLVYAVLLFARGVVF